MFNKDFDPLAALEQLNVNQQNMAMAINNQISLVQDHHERLELNQQTINQILSSLQNQQKLIMTVFDEIVKIKQVNISKDTVNDQTSDSNQGR